MNEQNIMENNEAIEVAEEITSSGSGHVLGIVGGVLAVAGLAYGSYKLYKKHRAKKELDGDNVVIEAKSECLDDDGVE